MKNKRIEIRVSKHQKSQIKELANQEKMTLSEYILDKSLAEKSPKIKREIYLEVGKMKARNFKVENNINQLAKHVNSNKNLSKQDFHSFEFLFNIYEKEVSKQNKLIRNLEEIFLK